MSALQGFGPVKAENVQVDAPGYHNQQEVDDELLGGGPGGGGTVAHDIRVTGVSVGNLADGATLAKGRSLTEVLTQMLVRRVGPAYQAPGAVLGSTPTTTTYEVGTVLPAFALQLAYQAGDGGVPTAYNLLLDNRLLAAAQRADLANLVLTTAPLVFTGSVAYAGGVAKADNLGVIDPRDPGRIAPGTAYAAPLVLRGVFPWFYGTVAAPALLTPAAVLAAHKVVAPIPGPLTVPGFGAGDQYFWFAVPASSGRVFSAWYRTPLDSGLIGGPNDLFGAPRRLALASPAPAWAQDYDVYLTNYPSNAAAATTLS